MFITHRYPDVPVELSSMILIESEPLSLKSVYLVKKHYWYMLVVKPWHADFYSHMEKHGYLTVFDKQFKT